MVTQRDIAIALGLSQAHVSRALRGIGRIDDPTRERVLACAAALGYLPNPQAGGLAGQRWEQQTHGHRQALAWVGGRGDLHERTSNPYAIAVRERIRALGYAYVECWADDYAEDAHLLADLARRRIAGVIVGETWPGHAPVQFPASLAVVQCGQIAPVSGTIAVRLHIEALLPLAVTRVFAAGYRHIAVPIFYHPGNHQAELLIAGWAQTCRLRLPGVRGKLFPWPRMGDGLRWAMSQEPEAILVLNEDPAEVVMQGGYVGPIACYGMNQGTGNLAGIRLDFASVGTLAVDKLDGLVRRGKRGLDVVASTELLTPVWTDGPSLPPRV